MKAEEGEKPRIQALIRRARKKKGAYARTRRTESKKSKATCDANSNK